MRVLAVVLLYAGIGLSQPSAPPARAGQERAPTAAKAVEGSIEGVVRNARDNSPVSKVAVRLWSEATPGPPAGIAESGIDGRFRFVGLAQGRYRLQVDKAGFVLAGKGPSGRSAATVSVATGQQVTGLLLRLLPAAVIRARVTDQDGDPIVGADLLVLQNRSLLGRYGLVLLTTVQTDDHGEARVPDRTAGSYFVLAVVSSRSDLSASGPVPIPTYYGDTPSIGRATPVVLVPGKETPVAIMVQKAETAYLRGSVSLSDGSVADSGIVRLSPLDAGLGMNFIGFTGPAAIIRDGHFEARVPAGPYQASVVAGKGSGAMESQESAQVPVEVAPGDENRVALITVARIRVAGIVRIEGGGIPKGVELSLVRARNDGGIVRGGSYGAVQPDGTIDLRQTMPGTYYLAVRRRMPGQDDLYIKSVVPNATPAPFASIRVDPRAPVRLQVSLSSAGARIEGTVNSAAGKPVPSATIVAIPDADVAQRLAEFPSVTSDQAGHYSLRGMAPGRYRIYALSDDFDDGEWFNPDFAKLAGPGEAVEVSEFSRKPLDLHLAVRTGKSPNDE